MGREPRVAPATLALAGVDMDLVVGVFTVAVDDVFSGDFIVFVKWIVGPKSVSVDGQRLLLADREEESDGRFVGGFRGHDVAVTGATFYENEHRWLVALVRSASTRGEATDRERESRSRAFLPAVTYTLSISTGPTRSR